MSQELLNNLYAYGPILIMVLIFYFLLYKPQKNREKKRTNMIDNIKVGHRVVSIGGIYGEVTYIDLTKSEYLRIKIADNVEISLSNAAIARDITQEKNNANGAAK